MSVEIINTMKKTPESSGFVKITPEVNMDSRILYLIRINKEEMAFVNSEEEAKLVVDSIAAEEIRRLENDTTEVYRKDSKDGRNVRISKKDLGALYNSSVYFVMEIDYLPVGHAILTKGRHELPSPTPLPPTLPPAKVLMESLERIRAEAQGKTANVSKNTDSDSEDDIKENDSSSSDDDE